MFGGIATKFSLIRQKIAVTIQQKISSFAWGLSGFNSTDPTINQFGLGNHISFSSRSPIQVGVDEWQDVECGGLASTTIGIKKLGTIWGWGRNSFGGIGDNTVVNKNSPVQIGSLSDWQNVYTDNINIVAKKTNNTLWTWGYKANSLVGTATTGNRSSPVQIGTDTDWIKVGNGNYCLMAIKSNNTLWGRGTGNDGQIGAPLISQSPAQVGTDSNWSIIGGVENGMFGIKTNGTLWGWGSGYGVPTGSGSSRPVQIGGETNWVDLCAFFRSGLLLKNNGSLWSFGYNNGGQLGRGNTISNNSPAQIGSSTDWSKLNKTKGFPTTVSTFAIKTNGTLWGWGSNFNGVLGDGTVVAKSSPVQIGTDTDWTFVSCNGTSTFAIKTNGTLWGWGGNVFGDIGIGNVTNRSSPVQVGIDTDWKVAYSLTSRLSVGVKTNGTLWAWGRGGLGLIAANRSTPIQIGALTDWNSFITQQSDGQLAIKTDGSIWQFGRELQNGQSLTYPKANFNTINTSPIKVSSENWTGGISSGSARYVTAAIKDNKLYQWGRRFFLSAGTDAGTGLGDNILLSPRQIGTNEWKDVKVSNGARVFAIKTDGTLWAWGRNYPKYLGLSGVTANFFAVSKPTQIGSFTDWEKIIPSFTHTLAVRANGTLWAWGLGTSGQLGLNAAVARSTPVQVGLLTNWFNASSEVKIRSSTSVMINSLGQLWAWGANQYGEIISSPKNTCQFFSKFEEIPGNTFDSLYQTRQAAFGKKSNNTLWAWGRNSAGELAQSNTTNQSSPVQVAPGSTWSKIATSNLTIHGIKSDGSLWRWGSANNGVAGDGTTVNRSSPVPVGTDTDWSKLKIKNGLNVYSVFAIKTNNTLWAWGLNTSGQLGVGNLVNRSSPVQVGTDSNWAEIVASSSHSMGLKTNGTIWAWGSNASGQLGDNTTASKSIPVQIGGLTSWTKISIGVDISFAIRSNGTLWAWGSNGVGRLGLGNTTSRSSPVQVGTDTDWSDIFANNYGAIGLKTNGTLWAWGGPDSGSGFFGNNSRFRSSSPVQIGSDSDWEWVTSGQQSALALKTNKTIHHTGRSLLLNQVVYVAAISSPVLSDSSSNWKKVSSVQLIQLGLKT